MTAPSALFAAMLRSLMARDTMPRLDGIAAALHYPDDRRVAGAFVAALSETHGPAAAHVLNQRTAVADFFRSAADRARAEIDDAATGDPGLLRALQVASALDEAGTAAQDLVWAVTFPEGVALLQDWSGEVKRLRHRRRVEIHTVAPNPITDPIRSLLVTANAVISAEGGDQDYWYDHPIPMGSPPDQTEIAHGLRALDAAVEVELRRHPEWTGPLVVVLSVSATHHGDRAARAYVADTIRAAGPFPRLRLFVFDESQTRNLFGRIMERRVPGTEAPVFGVAGPYGRQYSFLKAIAAVWAVCVDSDIRATFKIDLDQSFPQEHLTHETGRAAFEYFTQAEWGATASASDGRLLDLGLIAGGLVDSADIGRSIFHPDVQPAQPQTAEDAVFFSRLPQALSTEAEICSREEDGTIERIHVTGGTNGVLIDSLRRWRLFTPSFFGRAEDQAYIVSGLDEDGARPAYLHIPGLRMRHDKNDLLPDLITRSKDSNHIGDLVRTRLFSSYGLNHKSLLDPFTGAFVSKLPITVTTLRLALHALAMAPSAAAVYLREGASRLAAADELVGGMAEAVDRERREWAAFYDALAEIESGLGTEEPGAWARVKRIRRLIDAASV